MSNVKHHTNQFSCIEELLDHANRDIMQMFVQNGKFEPFAFIYGPYRVTVELRDKVGQAIPELEEA